jgi:YVTN family beta-propeller protein
MTKKLMFNMALGAIVLLSACTKDPINTTPTIPTEDLYKSGVYIVNEGGFGSSNASIDLFNKDSNILFSNIFEAVNNRPLGDVAQSMNIINNKGYILLNGSAKIEVIKAFNAQSIATITGFSSPRFMVNKDTLRGFVSDWVSNTVKEINLVNNTITRSINVGSGPEGMCIVGNKLFVANCGAYGLDSTISIIDLTTNTETKKLKVGDAPVAIYADANGKLWVLCRGAYGDDFNTTDDDSEAKFVRVNPTTESIEASIQIGLKGDHPDKMKMNAAKNSIYYLSSYNLLPGIFKFNITDATAPTTAFVEGYFYGIGYDKVADEVYLADAVDFKQRGNVYRYSSSGTLIGSFQVGIIPNGIQEQ